MGNIRVGDELWGYPIVSIIGNKITIEPAPGTPISFDGDQLTQTTLDILALALSFVPHH